MENELRIVRLWHKFVTYSAGKGTVMNGGIEQLAVISF